MKPSSRARYAAAVTLSKGKMFEYAIPIEDHLKLPDDIDLEQQFPMAIGTLGDYAATVVRASLGLRVVDGETTREEVVFAAQVLQAFDESRLATDRSVELRVLAAAAFYLADVPGSATILARRLASAKATGEDPLAEALVWSLDRPWNPTEAFPPGGHVGALVAALADHFREGTDSQAAAAAAKELQRWAYSDGSNHELLEADLVSAIALTRIAKSGWTLLPKYSDLDSGDWRPYLGRPTAIKEMWPAQRMLGTAGLYRGESAVVQMPTSAGKTRAMEVMLRAAFLSKRTRLAVVVAPFRALCQEIANDLQGAFREDGYQVNQLSDALQSDYKRELLAFLEGDVEAAPHVVVLTPEKLFYVLRQEPQLVEGLGLVVYDEGHQFDTGTRGVTYELLLTSIRRLLPSDAQTVLISAVIQNAAAIAKWLLSDEKKIVLDQRTQTRRLFAFTSFPKGKTGQLRFNVAREEEVEFFLPRVIVPEELQLFGKERKRRAFPTQESGSIALYLALKLVAQGGIAIYTRTKASAAKIVRDAVEETFPRSVSLPPPTKHCDADELVRFRNLFAENYGATSYLTRGAELGLFAHHGNTPHGVRLAIEHAMRMGLIRIIVCTSTLAQGVNLPIRYLLVTTPMQGRDAIKARDFHNLMGRAGRAGMYGEGTVIFTDHRLYDLRTSESYRWNAAQALLHPERADPTGSTLLELLSPMRSEMGRRVIGKPTPVEIVNLLIDDKPEIYRRIDNLPAPTRQQGFTTESLRRQLDVKASTLEAIESFLMTYRGDLEPNEFVSTSRALARETLAHSLASPEEQVLLENVFENVARRIEANVADKATQLRYGKTLLGIDHNLLIDRWINANAIDIGAAESGEELFEVLWALLKELSEDARLSNVEPPEAMIALARGWLTGKPYKDLFGELEALDAGTPTKKGKQRFTIDAVVEICEQTIGFEFAMFVAAVKESFRAIAPNEESFAEFASYIDLLQKRMKYGLPSADAIAYFEVGFSERVIAQEIALQVWEPATTAADARRLVRENADEIAHTVAQYPSYFSSVFRRIVG